MPAISEDEIPFDIPESWEWVRLGEITQFKGGYAYKSGKYTEKSTNQIVRLGNVKNDKLVLDIKPVYIDDDYAKETADYKIENGDILFTMTGTRGKRDYFYSVFVQSNILNLYLNQRVGCLKTYDRISGIWLCNILKAELVLQQVFINETGTANQGNIGSEKTMEILIPIPPLSEQQRIVAKIEEFLPLVDQYDKAYSQLTALNEKFPQDMKKSILQYAIEGKLVEQRPEEGTAKELLKEIKLEKEKLIKEGKIKKSKPLPAITEDEIPFEIPDSWEWCRLEEVLLSLTDGTHSTPHYTESGIPFLSVKNISSGKIDFHNTKFISVEEHEELKKRCYPQKGDILLSKVGTTGIPVAIGCDTEFSIFVSIALLKCTSDIDTYFLVKLLESPIVQEQCKLNTRGVGNKNWVLRDIANTIIPIPPLSEQRRIVEHLEQLLTLCDKLIVGEK